MLTFLTDTSALIHTVKVQGKPQIVDRFIVNALIRMAETITSFKKDKNICIEISRKFFVKFGQIMVDIFGNYKKICIIFELKLEKKIKNLSTKFEAIFKKFY